MLLTPSERVIEIVYVPSWPSRGFRIKVCNPSNVINTGRALSNITFVGRLDGSFISGRTYEAGIYTGYLPSSIGPLNDGGGGHDVVKHEFCLYLSQEQVAH